MELATCPRLSPPPPCSLAPFLLLLGAVGREGCDPATLAQTPMTYDEPVFTCHPLAFLRETDSAILINIHGEDLWIPLSQVKEIHRGKDGNNTLVITSWIAKKKNLM